MIGLALALLVQTVSPALITQVDAIELATGAVRACAARNERVSVFVTDAEGNLRAALSSDGALASSLVSATRKNAAVLAFKASTRDLQARAETDPAFAAQHGKDERYRFSPGGVPIYRQGKFVAVVAVGGGHAADEDCALDALRALHWASTHP